MAISGVSNDRAKDSSVSCHRVSRSIQWPGNAFDHWLGPRHSIFCVLQHVIVMAMPSKHGLAVSLLNQEQTCFGFGLLFDVHV